MDQHNQNQNNRFLKIRGTILVNGNLMLPATFIILFGSVNSFFIFSNFFHKNQDKVVCCLPENIKMTGTIVDSGAVPDAAFKKIEPLISKSIVHLDDPSKAILAYSKEIFRKDYTYVI
jgi:hypothetical protein